ncbi:MAG TPA: ImcF-related family protein, partial [Polyangium sp.]|nr:ImcF-related family protein [Polyangium sp.]
VPEADLRAKLLPHVKYYVDLLRRGATVSETLDIALVERTRDILARVGPAQRFYDRFVTKLEYEKHDENGAEDKDNLIYPPISLDTLFSDRPGVLSKLRSSQKERNGKWFIVRGPYTAKGYAQVVASLKEGLTVLKRERWIVPLTQEEERQGDKIQQALARVREDYDAQYIREWVEFFQDIKIEIPQNNKAAIEELRVLSTPDWPYHRLLRTLEANTLFDEVEKPEAPEFVDGGVLDQNQATMNATADAKAGRVAAFDSVPRKFRSMVRFGMPAPGGASMSLPLARYTEELIKLLTELAAMQDRRPAPGDAAKAVAAAEAGLKQVRVLSLTMDETGQELLEPLLEAPLKNVLRINR